MIKIRILRSEYFKLKKFYIIYFFIIELIFGIIFSSLFLNFYTNIKFKERLEFLFGIISVIIPIFISIISILSVEQEKNANKFQNIILNKNYIWIYFCKVLIIYIFFCIFNFILWLILGLINYNYLFYFIFIGIGSSIFSIHLFLIHFFINIAFNYNFSLIFSIFESILIIFATNGVFDKIWCFFPSIYFYKVVEIDNLEFKLFGNIVISMMVLLLLNLYRLRNIKK